MWQRLHLIIAMQRCSARAAGICAGIREYTCLRGTTAAVLVLASCWARGSFAMASPHISQGRSRLLLTLPCLSTT